MAQPITLNTEGLLLNWLKEVGDEVKSGEVVAEVEADKATVEIEATADGVLVSQDAEIGEELEEGAVIGSIGSADEVDGDGADEGSGEATPAEEEPEAAAQAQSSPDEQSQEVDTAASNGASRTPEGRIKASPLAKRIAEDKGVDLSQVPGSGPGGRIVKADVENFDPSKVQKAPAKPAQGTPAAAQAGRPTWGKLPQESDDVEIIDLSRMRQAVADGTTLSKSNIPHFYVTMDIDVAPLLGLRKQINASLEAQGVRVSVNDFIIKAAALTLREFPNLNSHFYGDKIVRYKRINIGVAVALEEGLINVVCKDADKISLSEMAINNAAMYTRAREGRIKPDDVKGATFTVSNLGPYNVDHFSAIINPPEAGIIAVGTAKNVPIVMEDGSLGVGNRMKVTISVDHRVSDGAEGADWLKYFKGLIEEPMRLLV